MKSGFVSVVGSPNAGKSTLINKIIGKKISIVSDKPQTTRDLIKGIYTTEENQIVFLDTPGFHKSYNKLNVYMNHKIDESFYNIDSVVYVIDAVYGLAKKEQANIARLKDVKVPIVAVINKIDLVSQEKVNNIIAKLQEMDFCSEIIAMSCKDDFNVTGIISVLNEYLTETVKFYDESQFYDYSDEFFVSEIIREKVFKLTSEEIPHSSGVIVTNMEEGDDGILLIEADIYVERDSQKAIIIGRAGSMIKRIGKAARIELKEEFETPIYLDLRVKVMSKWARQTEMVEKMGYEIE